MQLLTKNLTDNCFNSGYIFTTEKKNNQSKLWNAKHLLLNSFTGIRYKVKPFNIQKIIHRDLERSHSLNGN